MTHLRVVPDKPRSLAAADLLVLEYVAGLLPVIHDAYRELHQGVTSRDLELTMRAARRFVGVGGLLGEQAGVIEGLLR